MNDLLGLLVLGLVSASLYAVAASGLVVTYTTSGIFNFAHGAVAMFCAFVYWQLSSPDAWDLPVWLSLVITLLVFAPGMGLLIDRVLMRRLHDASPITRVVVPIGLLVALIQLATIIWSPARSRNLPRFFAGDTVELAGVVVEYHQIVVIATAIAVAIGLRVLLYETRIGVAMRAVVDSRELASLNGMSPDRVSGLAWALGCSLAGLAGVLIAPILTLDQSQLTLLVINAYAAAMVGSLRSLPLTAVGAIILGLLREAASRYNDSLPFWITVDTVPALMLFVVLVVVPQDKATVFGAARDRSQVPNPGWRKVFVASSVLLVLVWATPEITRFIADSIEGFSAPSLLGAVGYGLALGIVALSLVPLTGYAGQISLAPLAFGGLGALVMNQVASDGNPLGLLAAAIVCGLIGAVVALPALRLKGLYLALSTFAFALFCEKAVFTYFPEFEASNAIFPRIGIDGFRATSDRASLVLMAGIFCLLGMVVTALRKGPLGRRLQAMKDSPAACATLGLNLTATKLQVFAFSAAIAGIGGALLASWRGRAGVEQFSLLQGALPGLPLVLMAVVGGIAAVAGVLLGAMLLAIFPQIGSAFPPLANLMAILPGLAGISLASNPDGAIAQAATQIRAKVAARRDPAMRRDTAGSRVMNTLLPSPSGVNPEAIAVGGSPTRAELALLDAEVGLDIGRCDVDS